MQGRYQRSLLWVIVLLGPAVGAATPAPAQTFNEFPVPTANSQPAGITAGPDGALWFTESLANKIGRITTAGVVTNEFPIPTPNGTNGFPQIITAVPDGALWFTECVAAFGSNQCTSSTIGRITTAGTITQFSIPVSPLIITTGPDGRRVVDVHGPGGVGLSAVGTGHLKTITAPGQGILARQREVKALVELRLPFELDRQRSLLKIPC